MIVAVLFTLFQQAPAPCGTKANPCVVEEASASIPVTITNPSNLPCVCRCETPTQPTQQDTPLAAACAHEHGFEAAAAITAILAAVGLLLISLSYLFSRLDKIVAAWRRSELPKVPWEFIFELIYIGAVIALSNGLAHWLMR